MYLVYKHTSPSGKSYIGITGDYDKRCREHKSASGSSKYSQCRAFHAAIRKYGWDAFTHEILYSNLTIEQANHRETQLINEYGTLAPYGYNLCTGGGVKVWSDASRLFASNRRKGMKFSDATRAIMSAQRKGRGTGKPKPGVAAAQSQQWVITTPTGEELYITNLSAFCRDNNLTQTCFMGILKGKQQQHRGYTIRRP